MLPIAAEIAVTRARPRRIGLPTLPSYPTPTAESRTPSVRGFSCGRSAQRRARLANRLDPCSGRVGPVIAFS